MSAEAVLAQTRLDDKTYRVSLNANHPLISDHVVNNARLVSGACQLQLLFLTISPLAVERIQYLSNVRFMSPCIVGENSVGGGIASESVVLDVVLQKNKSQLYSFEIAGKNQRVHTKGKIQLAEKEPFQPNSSAEKCQISLQTGELGMRDLPWINTFFETRGSHYGEAYSALRSLRFNDDHAVGQLNISLKNSSDFSGFRVHPSLFDAAVQTAIGIISQRGLDKSLDWIYVPFALGKVTIVNANVAAANYRALIDNVRLQANDNMLMVDIVVVDEQQDIFLKLDNFALMKMLKFRF